MQCGALQRTAGLCTVTMQLTVHYSFTIMCTAALPGIMSCSKAEPVLPITFNFTAQQGTTLLYSTLLYSTIQWNTMQYSTTHYNALESTIMHYSAQHCTAMQYTVLLFTILHYIELHFPTLRKTQHSTPCTVNHPANLCCRSSGSTSQLHCSDWEQCTHLYCTAIKGTACR